jgi:hypothetical protein
MNSYLHAKSVKNADPKGEQDPKSWSSEAMYALMKRLENGGRV